jgi:two-component system, chemotaxis family, protein-glutamate methylesterase/glutaminase
VIFVAITVLIADDSPFMLNMITQVVSSDQNFKVLGQAKTGIECITKVIQLNPKIIVLDIMLPDTSGLEIVYQIMRAKPTPVLLFSSLTETDVKSDSRIFDYGIVDFITKPIPELEIDPLIYMRKVMLPKLSILAKLRIEKFKKIINMTNHDFAENQPVLEYKPKPVVLEDSTTKSVKPPSKVLVIGSSTGGPQMIAQIIETLPANFAPVLIVQHIPSGFIESFVARVNKLSKINVVTAAEGMPVTAGNVYLAPGGFHLELIQLGGEIQIKLTDGPYVNFVKPSVDVTLKSAVKIFNRNIVTAILTGMGKDGTEGCAAVKKVGGTVIALNEDDSVVYGMNKSVIEAGYADKIYSLKEMVDGFKMALGYVS